MTTRSGVGTNGSRDSREAGRDAALAALEALEGMPPSLVLVFATAGHDQQSVLDGAREVTGHAKLAGCSAEGVITHDGSFEVSHAVAVMVIGSDDLAFGTHSATGFARDAAGCARELARGIRERGDEPAVVLLFPDGILGNCRELLAALEAELPWRPTILGGTAGDLLNFQQTWQYHDGQVKSDSVTAVTLSGRFDSEVVITHGCDLVGIPRTVTRAEHGFVYSIDDQPAWRLFKGYLDSETDSLEAMHVAHLLLAEHLPISPSGLIDDFTVRVPVKLDAEHGALYFAAGLETGTRVQVALRNEDKVCDRAIVAASELRARRGGQDPLFVLQFDCAGRGRLLLGDRVTERLIHPVQQVLGEAVPWIGLHTYGEIAPIEGRTYFHNYTAVLCGIYPPCS